MAVKGAIIAIDFDGTVVTHAYPHMGMDAGAVPVLKELVANDCKLILYTMRSGQLLEKAVQWFKEQKIPLVTWIKPGYFTCPGITNTSESEPADRWSRA